MPTTDQYVAMQAAVPARAYDPQATYRAIPFALRDGTPELYRFYPAFAPPAPYFDQAAGARRYANFYNPRDWALDMWLWDQDLKPVDCLGYSYTKKRGFGQWRGLYPQQWWSSLSCPADTFELFAYCVEGQCFALGTQAGVEGPFTTDDEIDLDASYAFGNQHKGHSAQFRSTLMDRQSFWYDLADTLRILSP